MTDARRKRNPCEWGISVGGIGGAHGVYAPPLALACSFLLPSTPSFIYWWGSFWGMSLFDQSPPALRLSTPFVCLFLLLGLPVRLPLSGMLCTKVIWVLCNFQIVMPRLRRPSPLYSFNYTCGGVREDPRPMALVAEQDHTEECSHSDTLLSVHVGL